MDLNTNNILDITLLKIYKDKIEIPWVNNFKQCYYPIFVGLMVDHEEQVLITRIKTNI